MPREEQTGYLLGQWQGGEASARDRLIARLHPELEQIAAARLRRERDSSLSTGDLMNDTILRLIQIERISVEDRAHLVALASCMMRRILVDHARQKAASKRRHVRVELRTNIDGGQRVDLLSLEHALMRLRAVDGALAELVEMRYFGGMTTADIAAVLGVSEPTVKRRWQVARAWLTDAMTGLVGDD